VAVPFTGRSSITRLPAISELQRTTNFCPTEARLFSTLNHIAQDPIPTASATNVLQP
jgi:hypothetical protein